MQIYHEEISASLSEKKIRVFENNVSHAGSMVSDHWHDSYEILYVRTGYGEQQINARRIKFFEGSVIVILPGDVHSTTATSDRCNIDVLQFVTGYFDTRTELLSELLSSVAHKTGKEIADLFDTIKKSSVGDGACDELILTGAVYMLCGVLSGLTRSQGSRVATTAFARRVCEYLNTHDKLRLESVCRAFAYTPEHFSRKFHSELGITYKRYCERIKMQRLLHALEDDGTSLSQIAEKLEYSDTSSLIRAFKRVYGMTPGAYRKLKAEFV